MLNVRNPHVDILRLCVWDADTFSQERDSEDSETTLSAICRVVLKDDVIGQCDRSLPARDTPHDFHGV